MKPTTMRIIEFRREVQSRRSAVLPNRYVSKARRNDAWHYWRMRDQAGSARARSDLIGF